ncbi:protein-L-isoaspartate(D-aspartate) O-methyltransferase [Candidatus Acetothermia bacterium]|nr:protein-L-isoaspartate(D-aspartate) O-methyltransferase [Candidatus Acetothermia bacterium]MBI3643267.1 protein-L-isoaspartate(D-aspartate) O-methyltransferase [Candidatus Acetothermia bacterium]
MIGHLVAQGIQDERILNVMGMIPRHQFIAPERWEEAYANYPLPIDEGQTISQPYIVAKMTESLALQPSDGVLEIGTGSGYQTAILAELASAVFTVERLAALSRQAMGRLSRIGYRNIQYKIGDGTQGWAEKAPFDAIISTAAAPEIPASLVEQLREGGRLVIPVGNRQIQKLLLVKKTAGEIIKCEICDCSFLPLLGKEGWPERERTLHG